MKTKPTLYILHFSSRFQRFSRTILFYCLILFCCGQATHAQDHYKIWVCPKDSTALPINNTITGNEELNKLFQMFHIEKYHFLFVNMKSKIYEIRLNKEFAHWGNSLMARLNYLNVFDFVCLPQELVTGSFYSTLTFRYVHPSVLPCSPVGSCNKELNAILKKYKVISYQQSFPEYEPLSKYIYVAYYAPNPADLYNDLITLNHLLEEVYVDCHFYQFPNTPSSDTVLPFTECDPISKFPWRENFEDNGTNLPLCWKHGEDIFGMGWDYREWRIVDNNTGPPPNAHSGKYKVFISLYCPAEASHYSELYTPIFDLSEVDDPVLSFWHMSLGLGTLSLWYKNSSTAYWAFLQRFSYDVLYWQKESIFLPKKSNYYRIAFVGVHLGGRYGELHLDDISITDGLGIYSGNIKRYSAPNPVHDYLTISGITPQLITLYDSQGKKIYSVTDYSNKIDMSHLSNGLYFLHIITDTGAVHVEKVVKQ